MRYTVESFIRKTQPAPAASLVFGLPEGEERDGWKAIVKDENGRELHVQCMDDTGVWQTHATFGPTGMPGTVVHFGSDFAPMVGDVDLLNALEDALAEVMV